MLKRKKNQAIWKWHLSKVWSSKKLETLFRNDSCSLNGLKKIFYPNVYFYKNSSYTSKVRSRIAIKYLVVCSIKICWKFKCEKLEKVLKNSKTQSEKCTLYVLVHAFNTVSTFFHKVNLKTGKVEWRKKLFSHQTGIIPAWR